MSKIIGKIAYEDDKADFIFKCFCGSNLYIGVIDIIDTNSMSSSKSKVFTLYKKVIFKDGKYEKKLCPFQIKDSNMVFSCECGCRNTISLKLN
jgi:hypothetical protein